MPDVTDVYNHMHASDVGLSQLLVPLTLIKSGTRITTNSNFQGYSCLKIYVERSV